jgi:hypothetical protein
MKKTISRTEFIDSFDDRHGFSYDGLNALFDYLEALEDDTGEEMALDVVEIWCAYTEYENMAEYNDSHIEHIESIDDLCGVTTVIDIDGTRFIVKGC